MKRVVITGIGCVTPLGIGKESLWSGVRRAESMVKPLTRFDASSLKSRIAASIDDFDPLNFMDAKSARRLDRFSQFAVACAGMALKDSRLALETAQENTMGVYIGSALGGVGNAEEEHTRLVQKGFSAVDKLIAMSVFSGAGAANVSIHFGLCGPALSNANSCASGTLSVGEAFRLIQRGDVDVMLAGGAEAPLYPLCFGAFDLIGAMSTRNETPQTACRPFDRTRDGFVMAEGAAIMVLEERTHALKRAAPIYAEILGYGATSDAHHMTIPRPDGKQAARAVAMALKEAKLNAANLDSINAHGSSTPLNDKTETLALKQALGELAARKIPVSATKAMHGHALGASGAMEMAISVLSLENQFLPATLNRQHPDPECDLNFVSTSGQSATLRHVLTHSFGFGGSNAALILGRM